MWGKVSLFVGTPLSLCVIVTAIFSLGLAQGVAKCRSNNNLKCFECNSVNNPFCADPFNWTTPPPLQRCQGCCVKMVQGIGTPDLKVVRTCISEIQISMFMVDLVCMSESNRRGKLCFCDNNLCNGAAFKYHSHLLIVLASLFYFTISILNFNQIP